MRPNDSEESLQHRFAPNSVCFGCGPRNTRGLHLNSVPDGESVLADWSPKPYHSAFSDFANGGIVSVLLDCHGNWTAAYSLMKSRSLEKPPGTVTAEYTVRFLKPTPIRAIWRLRAWPTKIDGNKVTIEGEVLVDGAKTVTMLGHFVAVREDHPAFHRWQ